MIPFNTTPKGPEVDFFVDVITHNPMHHIFGQLMNSLLFLLHGIGVVFTIIKFVFVLFLEDVDKAEEVLLPEPDFAGVGDPFADHVLVTDEQEAEVGLFVVRPLDHYVEVLHELLEVETSAAVLICDIEYPLY